MPFYEVHHSHSDDESQPITRSITDLDCAAFSTLSFYVHVKSIAHDVNDRPSCIIGVVHTSSSRTEMDFDTLAANIQDT